MFGGKTPPLLMASAVASASVAMLAYARRTRGHDRIHPELRSAFTRLRTPSIGKVLLTLSRPLEQRSTPCVEGVSVETIDIDVLGGGTLSVALYRPAALKPVRGAMLYSHGGGMITGSIGSHQSVTSAYARDLGILVISTEYRLAPKHPFPAALDDIHAAYRWLISHAEVLGIDAGRIVVAGDSAGGGLTASLCQRIRDAGDPPPVFQLLVYPMLDDRTAITTPEEDTGQILWTRGSNLFGWSAYLGFPPGKTRVPEHAVPARRESLSGLPPAWIGVGTLDLFHAEDEAYAHRLREAGVECELIEIAGAYHGFDVVRPHSTPARLFRDSALRAVRRALRLEG